MLTLKPITHDNINDFDGTSYEAMSAAERKTLISESIGQLHNDRYFEFLVVYDNDHIVGFMNLFAHSEHIISCGPAIKTAFQKQGFGFAAESMALNYAKSKGFTIAVGGVDEHNAASIALHEKLGFEMERTYTGTHGRTIRLYIKAL